MTLIIFDYDDTLFPTTYYSEHDNLTKDDLFYVDAAISDIFSQLLEKKYTIIIITNGNMGWFNESLKLLPYTNNMIKYNSIRVISSRDVFEKTCVKYEDWKRFTVLNVLINDYCSIDKVIGIGDSDVDHIAIKDSCNYIHKAYDFIKIPRSLPLKLFEEMLDKLLKMLIKNK